MTASQCRKSCPSGEPCFKKLKQALLATWLGEGAISIAFAFMCAAEANWETWPGFGVGFGEYLKIFIM
jgi:hypothetical protein